MRADDPGLGDALTAMLGPSVRRFRMAHLTVGNGVGLQVFEFADPVGESNVSGETPWHGGFTHLCVTAPDIEALAQQIAERGGRSSSVFRSIPGRPYAAYCSDPWGPERAPWGLLVRMTSIGGTENGAYSSYSRPGS